MRLRLCVPFSQRLVARNWNLARSGCPFTALMVANNVGVSTPFSGLRSRVFGSATCTFDMTVSPFERNTFCSGAVAPTGGVDAPIWEIANAHRKATAAGKWKKREGGTRQAGSPEEWLRR